MGRGTWAQRAVRRRAPASSPCLRRAERGDGCRSRPGRRSTCRTSSALRRWPGSMSTSLAHRRGARQPVFHTVRAEGSTRPSRPGGNDHVEVRGAGALHAHPGAPRDRRHRGGVRRFGSGHRESPRQPTLVRLVEVADDAPGCRRRVPPARSPSPRPERGRAPRTTRTAGRRPSHLRRAPRARDRAAAASERRASDGRAAPIRRRAGRPAPGRRRAAARTGPIRRAAAPRPGGRGTAQRSRVERVVQHTRVAVQRGRRRRRPQLGVARDLAVLPRRQPQRRPARRGRRPPVRRARRPVPCAAAPAPGRRAPPPRAAARHRRRAWSPTAAAGRARRPR